MSVTDPRHIDPREVLRGKCSKCDCAQYELEKEDRDKGKSSCSYCQCPPPAHERIERNLSETALDLNNQTYAFFITPSKNGGMRAEVGNVTSTIPMIVVPHTSDLPSSSHPLVLNPQKNLLSNIIKNAEEEIKLDDIPMPNALADNVINALAKKKLDAKHRSSICRAVVNKLLDEEKASNGHLKIAAKKILLKYSPMRRGTDPHGTSLYKKLARARDRMKAGPAIKSSSNSETSAPLRGEEAREAMVEDWAAGKKSITTMRPYLEATRALRNKEACKTKSLNLLVDYPALTIPELLLHEFGAMAEIQVPVSRMRENWIASLPHFRKYFSDQAIYRIDEDFSVEQQTVMILENIHRMPLWLKNVKSKRGQQAAEKAALENRACRVLEVFPENTPIAEARPNAKDPLRLSAIGESMGTLNLFAITDAEPIFSTEDPITAMLLLLSTYWVLHLNFGVSNKLPIIFLAACTLGTDKVKDYVSKNDKFLDLCRDHFNLEV